MSTDGRTPTTSIASTNLQSSAINTTPSLKHQKSINDDNQSQNARRSSSRSIKRKKFDDELVESSIILPKGQRGKNILPPTAAVQSPSIASPSLTNLQPNLITNTINNSTQKAKLNSPSATVTTTDNNLNQATAINTPTVSNVNNVSIEQTQPITPTATKSTPIEVPPTTQTKKPKPITTTTKRRRYRNAHNNAVKDLGRWKPQDDLALVVSVQQLNDLEAVYRSVKFSCKFNLKEIENRWYGLLYDPTIAKIGVAAMRQLHPDIVAQIHSNAPYNEDEEKLLKAIESNSHPTLEVFTEILQKHIEVFLPYRTAKNLNTHWLLLKHYHLLDDQNVKNFNKLDIPNFSDTEEQIENDLQTTLNSNVPPSPVSSAIKQEDIINQELALNNRKTKREIRQLENEIPKWQVLVDNITGVAASDFDNETLAVLRGRLVRYLMRSREITIGRSTKDSLVDVDLSLGKKIKKTIF